MHDSGHSDIVVDLVLCVRGGVGCNRLGLGYLVAQEHWTRHVLVSPPRPHLSLRDHCGLLVRVAHSRHYSQPFFAISCLVSEDLAVARALGRIRVRMGQSGHAYLRAFRRLVAQCLRDWT